jgi:lysine-ketoglutarate reductase/saccharopine dehydrogenase-like protein (TIGR00300 family)
LFHIPAYKHPDFSSDFFTKAPDVAVQAVEKEGVAPEGFHATSMYPEYFKVGGEWRLITGSRMDCVPVLFADGEIEAKEARRLQVGERVILGRTDDGSEGIYLYTKGFLGDETAGGDAFAFRTGRNRETSFASDYQKLFHILKNDKDNGHIIWVLGPAAIFDRNSRRAMEYMIENGYCHAVFGGNAVATHDLEGAMFNTALGQDLDTSENVHNGHYHHLDLLNRVTREGSVEKAVEKYDLDGGLICACLKNDVPFVLAGSLRDDGPLPEVCSDMGMVQDKMRAHTARATTVVCLATQLHSIATGNMTPCYVKTEDGVRPVFIVAVDVSEFALNKLRDRGSLEVTTIVSNIQDFLYKITSMLKEDEA